jgi:hypothetical protein
MSTPEVSESAVALVNYVARDTARATKKGVRSALLFGDLVDSEQIVFGGSQKVQVPGRRPSKSRR